MLLTILDSAVKPLLDTFGLEWKLTELVRGTTFKTMHAYGENRSKVLHVICEVPV